MSYSIVLNHHPMNCRVFPYSTLLLLSLLLTTPSSRCSRLLPYFIIIVTGQLFCHVRLGCFGTLYLSSWFGNCDY